MLNSKLILFFIIILGLVFRIYGINWDQNHHLHPDERFLTMVVTAIKWPDSLSRYLDQEASPLNPANANFSFFVYGTLPLFIVKFAAEYFKLADYNGITIVGRYLSAIFDTLTIVVVYKIAGFLINKQRITNNEQRIKNNLFTIYFPLLSALFYALAVLPIQLSHYFAVDTFLVFFSTFSLYLALRFINNQKILYAVLSGIMLGCALASKISALFFLPFIFLAFLTAFLKNKKSGKNVLKIFISALVFLLASYFVFRFTNPYAFASGNFFKPQINQLFINNLKQLKSWDSKETAFAPGLQWVPTKPVIYSFSKIIYYGLGLPIGIFALLGIILSIFHLLQPRKGTPCKAIMILMVLLTCSFFLYQSTQFIKAMRYFAFIYPFFAFFAGYAFYYLRFTKAHASKLNLIITTMIIFFSFIWTFMFVSIYSKKHSRVVASKWIYQNIPTGSTLTCEHWDDCLPVGLSQDKSLPFPLPQYKTLELPLYNPDNPEKWQKVEEVLNEADYIILSSSRLYGSIMSVPDRYPQTYKYYQDLFNGNLGFEKVAEFTSRPNLPIPFVKWCINMPFEDYGGVAKKTQECDEAGISIVDDYTDESFTVYDHPKVVIFGKVKNVDYFPFLPE